MSPVVYSPGCLFLTHIQRRGSRYYRACVIGSPGKAGRLHDPNPGALRLGHWNKHRYAHTYPTPRLHPFRPRLLADRYERQVLTHAIGGIVALGVFKMGWKLEDAIRHFSHLSKKAFTKRRSLDIPAISWLFEPFCTFRYQSDGINQALQSAFGKEFLFGQPKMRAYEVSGDKVIIGVVSCLEGRNQPCLIANYNRNPKPNGNEKHESCFDVSLFANTVTDILQREDRQSDDFKIWQA